MRAAGSAARRASVPASRHRPGRRRRRGIARGPCIGACPRRRRCGSGRLRRPWPGRSRSTQTTPSVSSSRFDGLMSRCTMPRAWRGPEPRRLAVRCGPRRGGTPGVAIRPTRAAPARHHGRVIRRCRAGGLAARLEPGGLTVRNCGVRALQPCTGGRWSNWPLKSRRATSHKCASSPQGRASPSDGRARWSAWPLRLCPDWQIGPAAAAARR